MASRSDDDRRYPPGFGVPGGVGLEDLDDASQGLGVSIVVDALIVPVERFSAELLRPAS